MAHQRSVGRGPGPGPGVYKDEPAPMGDPVSINISKIHPYPSGAAIPSPHHFTL